MSFDLYIDETRANLSRFGRAQTLGPGVFDNFLRGTGAAAMRTFAEAGRAVDLAGAVGPIIQDKFTGGTVAQDRYFKEHDEVFGRAVDHWTPKPNEVGIAGEIAGQLLATLPMVIASPGFTVGQTLLSTGETLVNKGVSPGKAGMVGAVQAAGLGLGIWAPILGRTLAQRMLVGGAGFNVVQGAATRGASGLILDGTPAAEDFKALDPAALTLDALLGIAFGGLVHLSPKARAQSEAAWKRIEEWTGKLSRSDKDALLTLRQAEHLNVESAPGRLVDEVATDAHVAAMRQAIDDLVSGRPVNVEQFAGAVQFRTDAARTAFQSQMVDYLNRQVQAVLREEMGAEAARVVASDVPGFLRTAEQKIALRDPAEARQTNPELARAIEIARKPGALRSAEERIFLEAMLKGRAADFIQAPDIPPARPDTQTAAAGAPRAQPGEGEARPDPLVSEAERVATERPDLQLTVGTDDAGNPVTVNARQYLDDAKATAAEARGDIKLMEVAAACLLGAR